MLYKSAYRGSGFRSLGWPLSKHVRVQGLGVLGFWGFRGWGLGVLVLWGLGIRVFLRKKAAA